MKSLWFPGLRTLAHKTSYYKGITFKVKNLLFFQSFSAPKKVQLIDRTSPRNSSNVPQHYKNGTFRDIYNEMRGSRVTLKMRRNTESLSSVTGQGMSQR